MKRITQTILVLSVSALPLSAQADRLVLNNGDQISGTVMLMKDPNALRFHTSFNQTIKVPWDQVNAVYTQNGQAMELPAHAKTLVQAARVATSKPPVTTAPIKLKPPPGIESAKLSSTTTAVANANTQTTAQVTAPATVAKATTVEDDLFWGAKWSGRANAGVSLQTGNTEQDSISLDAQLKAKWGDKHRATLEAEYNRETDDGDVTEDNRTLRGLYDYFFDDQWFMNTTLGFEQDDIDLVDLRTTAGLGLGYQAYERDDLNLQFILGPSYLRTEFENGDSEDSLAGRWELDYDQKFFDELIQLFHNHEFLVPSDDTGAFLFDSKTGVRIPLKKGLVGTAEVDFEWDNDPEPGVLEDDTQYSVKLGYEW